MISYSQDDTITAEATPPGRGGISVIRISGRHALVIVEKFFDREMPQAGAHKFGKLVNKSREPIDNTVITFFQAPHSYTGEDVVEISTHGSPVVVAEALSLLYDNGARPAEPGEFTLRAFLNGRLDLTQAEAVGDLIASSSKEAAHQAVRQLEGGIGRAADGVARVIERLMISAELELDFSEEDVELMNRSEKLKLADQAIEASNKMLEGYLRSRRLREGVKVVISGAPNVGKSSLFNALVGADRAIVHPTAGTTRDVVSARTFIGGIEFEFFDTAGIRIGEGEIEDEGIRRALKAAEEADIVLEVDSVDLPGKDREYAQPAIRVRNKCDLMDGGKDRRIGVSSVTGTGVEELRLALLEFAAGNEDASAGTISRERHYRAVVRAVEALKRGREALTAGASGDMVAEEWREALAAFDELTGKRRLEGLLETIFGEFCIGK